MPPPEAAEPVEASEMLLAPPAPRSRTRFDRLVLRVSSWLGQHPRIRLVLALVAMCLSLAPGVVLLFFDVTDGLSGFSYFGVFLTNLASTATFYIPVPGLTAAAQLLIITEADKSGLPWLVGIAGGLGMAAGEVTAYYAGYLGAEIVRGRELPGPARFRPTIERIIRGIGWLMGRWGMATLFVLSALPNPLFEIAGLTAGSVRMPFRRFFVSVTAGKIVRGLLLAYFGTQLNVLPFVDI